MERHETSKEPETAVGEYEPRRLTFGENVKLTIKVLAGAGALIASLWGLDLLTSGQ